MSKAVDINERDESFETELRNWGEGKPKLVAMSNQVNKSNYLTTNTRNISPFKTPNRADRFKQRGTGHRKQLSKSQYIREIQ